MDYPEEHLPAMGTNALIYTRASMDRKYLMRSTGDQETDCRTWCDQQEWAVGKVITDANRSASKWRTREREGFEEALTLIASNEYDAFVTWEPSRAGRELLAYVQLRGCVQRAKRPASCTSRKAGSTTSPVTTIAS
ncbi:recombinase family protein [Auritidibacter ignavus]|uniref:Recombinase family protein n=1 Tax=Auritidibacter ignavus TaxID=678932 RepID=A0AAJ6DD28_9MICC|nr:recombinase family protein [Auritidibacter ignavus]WGH84854.1 recombinase family protein [Auritidibacter ignavus]WGH94290.1 recombinase family protein [Auritidibacter ignavus]